jgi:hypothetical protein
LNVHGPYLVAATVQTLQRLGALNAQPFYDLMLSHEYVPAGLRQTEGHQQQSDGQNIDMSPDEESGSH